MPLFSLDIATPLARARIGAPADSAHARCAGLAWSLALALGLASGCTDPSFTPLEGGVDLEDDGGLEEQRTDRNQATESGREPPADGGDVLPDAEGASDAGGGAQASAACEGGACSSAEAGASSMAVEAGASSVGSDAGAPLDEVRAKWAGRYAVRSAMFAFERPIFDGIARALSVIEIMPTSDGGLRLEEEMCDYAGEWQSGVGLNASVNYSHNGARGSAPLQFDGEKFSSEQFSVRFGYGPTPAGCSPGATVMRQAHQTWLTNGTCDCPRSNDTPTSARDCRLTDPEKDSEPGASLSASYLGDHVTLRVALELRARLLDGYSHNGRLYANREFSETTRLLSCTVNGAPGSASSCPLSPNQSCPARYNRMELVPITGAIKCAQVIAMETALFLSPMPMFPSSCPSELGAAP